MDGLPCPYSNLGHKVIQIGRQGVLPDSVLSHCVIVVGGTLLGDTQPQASDGCGGIDCLSTYITDFYIEHVAFYHTPLTLCGECYGACMCILIKLLLRTVKGRVPALLYMLLGARGLLWPCLIIVG
jgi:hypothetical protein